MTERLGPRVKRQLERGYQSVSIRGELVDRDRLLAEGRRLSSDYLTEIRNLTRVLRDEDLKPAARQRRKTHLKHLKNLSTELSTGLTEIKAPKIDKIKGADIVVFPTKSPIA